MNRREALNKTTWIAGSAIFGSGMLGVIQGCVQQEVTSIGRAKFLNKEQFDLIALIVDTILPQTDTPSATQVGVHQYIDLLFGEVFDDEVKKFILTGLKLFDDECRSVLGKTFSKLDQQERDSYVEQLDAEIMSKEYPDQIPFYAGFKKMVITIYVSTEEGVKQNFDYRPVPGSYKGDTTYQLGDRIIVKNQHMRYEPK